MILQRCFFWEKRARPDGYRGPLWFPRAFQGDGRHDNPGNYACLYTTEDEVSGVVEVLANYMRQPLAPFMLRFDALPLAVARLELPDDAPLIDLDEPRILSRHRLRPSLVATRRREITQPQALGLYESRPESAGIRWWSTYESLWANVTLFDRAASALRLVDVRELTVDDEGVVAAADFLLMR